MKNLNAFVNNTPLLITLIIVATILLSGLIFLFYFFVIRRNRIKRKAHDLIRRWEYLHNLLISQDSAYVRRLEMISRSNLLYTDIHSKFHIRYREISTKRDSSTQNEINKLRENLDLKKYKIINQEFPAIKQIIDEYDQEVTKINEDLLEIIRPEEECKQACIPVKEKLRLIKTEFYSKQNQLEIVAESFDSVFTSIDNLILEYDAFVDSANYDDANNQLITIKNATNELEKVIRVMPALCALAEETVPNKINQLNQAYRAMIEKEYPLHHLLTKNSIVQLTNKLKANIVLIKKFNIAEVESNLYEIIEICDKFIELFEKEKIDRDLYENNCIAIYNRVTDIEKECVRLYNSIPRIEKCYIISSESYHKMGEIQENIDRLSNIKRAFDTFVHNANMQPYSLLVNKMNELKDESDKIDIMLRDFNSYLNSLKTDSESAYELIFSYYLRIKELEKRIRDGNSECFKNKYKDKIERIYILLDSINQTLNILPIDVGQINAYVDELKEDGNRLINLVVKETDLLKVAEAAIVYANRDRHHLSDVNTVIKQSEQLFFEGEFEKSYIQTGDLLKRFRESNPDN